MLATLSGIQQSRRAADLEDKRFEEQKRQFATSMGFQEKSTEYKKVADLLDAIARSSSESRSALGELGKSLGLPADSIVALQHYGQTAPESSEMFANKRVQQGYAQANAQDQGQMNAGAATRALTGMAPGAMQADVLQGQLAGGGNPQQAYGADMMARLAQGFAQQAATRQTPLQAQVDQRTTAQPGLIAQMAGMQAGNMGPAQLAQNQIAQGQLGVAQGQLDVARGGVQADFYRTNAQLIANSAEVAAKLASSKALGGMTMEQYTQATNSMRELIQAVGKEKNEASRNYLMSLYNNLAGKINPGLMANNPDEMPGKSGLLDRMGSAINPPGMTGQPQQPTQPPPRTGPPPYQMQPNPLMNSPWPQFQNPMTPFINRP